MKLRNDLDALIEFPVVTSFTRVGFAARKALQGWKPTDSYDLHDRVVVVTGATSGIGRATATSLARCSATVVVVGRDETRNAAAAAEISRLTGNPNVSHVAADMGDYSQVRALAHRVLSDHDRLDVLVHNAGALSAERRLAPDGTEATVASQVVGPFLLTGLLLERLAATPPTRVVTVSSGGMYSARLTVSGLQLPAKSYKGATQYALAKRAQVALNEEWAQRFGHLGIHFHSMHPGWADTPGVDAALPAFARIMGPLLRTSEEGADTVLWLAGEEAALQSNGKFWLDRRVRATHRLPGTRRSDTPNRRAELWDWVSATCGLVPAAP